MESSYNATLIRYTFRSAPPHHRVSPHPTSDRSGGSRRIMVAHRHTRAHARGRQQTIPPIGVDSFENAGLRDRKGIPGPLGTDRPGKRLEKGLRGLSPVAGDLRPQGRSFPVRGRGGRSSCSRGRRRRSHHGCRRSIRRGGRRPPARSRRSGHAHDRSGGPVSRRS